MPFRGKLEALAGVRTYLDTIRQDYVVLMEGDLVANLPLAEITQPPLTTLAQDIGQKARLVVDMLLRHIRQETLAPERTLLGVWLVERQSVRRIGPPVEVAE